MVGYVAIQGWGLHIKADDTVTLNIVRRVTGDGGRGVDSPGIEKPTLYCRSELGGLFEGADREDISTEGWQLDLLSALSAPLHPLQRHSISTEEH